MATIAFKNLVGPALTVAKTAPQIAPKISTFANKAVVQTASNLASAAVGKTSWTDMVYKLPIIGNAMKTLGKWAKWTLIGTAAFLLVVIVIVVVLVVRAQRKKKQQQYGA